MTKLLKDYKHDIAELKAEYMNLQNRMVEAEDQMLHMHHEMGLCDELHEQVHNDEQDITALDKTLKMMSQEMKTTVTMRAQPTADITSITQK